MSQHFDLSRALRKLKPEKRDAIAQREEGELLFAEDEEPTGPPIVLDTCVYIHTLRGKIPQSVDLLLSARTLYHSATALAELTYRLGARLPSNPKEVAARAQLRGVIEDIPAHRVVFPSPALWGEAGILAGIRARVGGFSVEQEGLDDALIVLQALAIGGTLLTANLRDFDILQQLVPGTHVMFYREIAP